jgi:hypothetical protein
METAKAGDPGMRSFAVLEWTQVAALALAGIAALPDGDPLYDPGALQGQHVLLDGTEYEVLGVDTCRIPRGPGRPYRHAFSLLVRKEAPGAAP